MLCYRKRKQTTYCFGFLVDGAGLPCTQPLLPVPIPIPRRPSTGFICRRRRRHAFVRKTQHLHTRQIIFGRRLKAREVGLLSFRCYSRSLTIDTVLSDHGRGYRTFGESGLWHAFHLRRRRRLNSGGTRGRRRRRGSGRSRTNRLRRCRRCSMHVESGRETRLELVGCRRAAAAAAMGPITL